MKQITLRGPDLMLLVGTRMVLGVGVGLLVATRLDERARRSAGIALLVVGVLTTVPILMNARAGAEPRTGSEAAGRPQGRVSPGMERQGPGAFRETTPAT